MTDLRSKLIRLAHARPELRDDLLPLIKRADREVRREAKETEGPVLPAIPIIVHNDKVVQTLGFSCAAQLYGPKAVTDDGRPAPWRNDWCGNKSRNMFDVYAGKDRKRYIVLPEGPDDYKTIKTPGGEIKVPVGEKAFTISVAFTPKDEGIKPYVANINDYANRYYGKHKSFDRAGAVKAVKELRRVIPLAVWAGEKQSDDSEEGEWTGIRYPELWSDSGFTPQEARSYSDTRAFRDSVGRSDDEHDLLSFLRVYKKHNRQGLDADDVDVCWATGISVDELLQLHSNYFTNEDIQKWADLTHFSRESLPVDLYVEMKEQGLTENHLKFVYKIDQISDYSGDAYRDPEAVAHATQVYAALGDAAPVVFDKHNEFVPDVVDWIRKDPQRRVSWIRRSGADYDTIWALQNLNVAPREDLNSYVSLAQKAGLTPVQLDESTPNKIPTVKDLVQHLRAKGVAVEGPKGRFQQLLDSAGVVDGMLGDERVPSFSSIPELVNWLKSRGALKRRAFRLMMATVAPYKAL